MLYRVIHENDLNGKFTFEFNHITTAIIENLAGFLTLCSTILNLSGDHESTDNSLPDGKYFVVSLGALGNSIEDALCNDKDVSICEEQKYGEYSYYVTPNDCYIIVKDGIITHQVDTRFDHYMDDQEEMELQYVEHIFGDNPYSYYGNDIDNGAIDLGYDYDSLAKPVLMRQIAVLP